MNRPVETTERLSDEGKQVLAVARDLFSSLNCLPPDEQVIVLLLLLRESADLFGAFIPKD